MPVLSEALPDRTPTLRRWRIFAAVFLLLLALTGVLFAVLRWMPRDQPYTLRLGGHVVYLVRVARPVLRSAPPGARVISLYGDLPNGLSWGTGYISLDQLIGSAISPPPLPPLLPYPYRLCYGTLTDWYLVNWY